MKIGDLVTWKSNKGEASKTRSKKILYGNLGVILEITAICPENPIWDEKSRIIKINSTDDVSEECRKDVFVAWGKDKLRWVDYSDIKIVSKVN